MDDQSVTSTDSDVDQLGEVLEPGTVAACSCGRTAGQREGRGGRTGVVVGRGIVRQHERREDRRDSRRDGG